MSSRLAFWSMRTECRCLHISVNTFFFWTKKGGGPEEGEARHAREAVERRAVRQLLFNEQLVGHIAKRDGPHEQRSLLKY